MLVENSTDASASALSASRQTDSWLTFDVTAATPSATGVLYYCSMYRMFMFGFVVGSICVIGLIGNFLSAYTVWPTRRTQAASLLIVALATFDTIFLAGALFLLTITWFSRFFSPSNWYTRWGYPVFFAYILPVTRWGQYCGSWTIVLITFQRYVAVCHPTKFKNWFSVTRTQIQLGIITICLLFFALPRAFYLEVRLDPQGTHYINAKTAFGTTFGYNILYETIGYFTVMYVIPIPCLIYLTYKLLKALKEAKTKRQGMTRHENDTENISRGERELSRTMIAVVVVFIVCQLPNPLRRLLLGVLPPYQTGCGYFYYYFHPWSASILAFNSAINFILYYRFGKRFRFRCHSRIRALLCLPSQISAASEETPQTS